MDVDIIQVGTRNHALLLIDAYYQLAADLRLNRPDGILSLPSLLVPIACGGAVCSVALGRVAPHHALEIGKMHHPPLRSGRDLPEDVLPLLSEHCFSLEFSRALLIQMLGELAGGPLRSGGLAPLSFHRIDPMSCRARGGVTVSIPSSTNSSHTIWLKACGCKGNQVGSTMSNSTASVNTTKAPILR